MSVLDWRLLVVTIDREKVKEKWLESKRIPTKLMFPSVKIIHHMLVYGPKGSMWLLIFAYHPNIIGTSRCQKFSFWDFSLCWSKKYFHKPRSPEATKGTNGRQNSIDCAKPNEALEIAEKAPRTSLLMKIGSNTGQGKRPTTQSRKDLVFFVNGIV